MKYQKFEVFEEKYLPPFHKFFFLFFFFFFFFFFTENPIQKCFDQNVFYLYTDFQTFCSTFCDKLYAQLCQENISYAHLFFCSTRTFYFLRYRII